MKDNTTSPPSRPRWRGLLTQVRRAAVLLVLAGAGMAAAQTARDRASDTLIKAAFLHKFASFVEWPLGSFSSSTSPLRIGVLGDAGDFRAGRGPGDLCHLQP